MIDTNLDIECAICYEKIKNSDGFTKLDCCHIFHLNCLLKTKLIYNKLI